MSIRSMLCFLSLAGLSLTAAGAVPVRLVAKVGDAVADSTISTLNSAYTSGNGKVAFLAGLADSSRIIWFDTGPIFRSTDALPIVLTGGEVSIGVSNAGGFIYGPTLSIADPPPTRTFDVAYTHAGLLLAEEDPAPGLPGMFVTFNSRPTMLAGGTAIWVAGFGDVQGGASDGRALYAAANPSDPDSIQIILKTGDDVGGFPISASGVGFTYDFSDSGEHHIHRLTLGTGSTSTDDVVYLDGAIVAQQGSASPVGENWSAFNVVGVNDNGDYVFSGDTDGATASDTLLMFNGGVALREGQVVDGLTLGSTIDWAAVNNAGQVGFVWDSSLTETLFLGMGADLANASALVSVGDELDIDGDDVGDFVLTDFEASTGISLSSDLSNSPRVYLEVSIEPIGGGDDIEAIIGVPFGAPPCAGDVNGDNVVDLADLATLLANFGTTGGATREMGDLDGDGDVDLSDLATLLANFGASC